MTDLREQYGLGEKSETADQCLHQLVVLNDQHEYVPMQKLMALETTINALHTKVNNSSRLAQDIQKVLNLSPKGSHSPSSSSSSNSSRRSVVFDMAGALIASFSNVGDKVKDMKVEPEEWKSPPSEREDFNFSRRVVYSTSEREAAIESLEPCMNEQAGTLEDEILEKIGDACLPG